MEMIPKSPKNWRRLLTLVTFGSVLLSTPYLQAAASTEKNHFSSLNNYKLTHERSMPTLNEKKFEVTINGKVTDLAGKAIPGVVVKHKESGKTTQTDAQGNYSLRIPEAQGTLVFSFIGFGTKEVVVGQQTQINVQLADDNKKLDEIVVVGYGTQKKVNLTGSVSTVSSKDLDNRPITQASQALSGLSPGVQVQQGGGRPGSDGARVIIRGVGTFNAGSSPLVLIDGIAGSLDDVAPDNIATMTVLKDAASAAIYGNRAANGVILITTKRGQKGKTSISYNNYLGWEKITSLPQFVDSWTYAELTGASADVVSKYRSGTDPDNFPNVPHLKNLLNTGSGFQQYHNVNVSGGEGNNVFYLSGSYRDHNGLTAETNNKRYDIQANIDTRIKDNLNLKTSILGFSQFQTQPQSNAAGIGGIIGFAVREPNTIAGLRSDGTYGRQDFFSPEAWLASEGFNNLRAKNFYGNTTLSWDIIPGLNLSGTAGYHYYTSVNTTYIADINIDRNTYVGPNSLNIGNTDGNEVTLNLLTKYVKSFGKHNLSILGGYQQETHRDNFSRAFRDRFPNNLLYQLDAGATTNQQTGGNANEYAFRSFFSRFNYDFGGKYLFEANVRYDGSSRFAPDNRYGVFPAVSAGWRLSEESFIKDNISWINELKIRASYGSLGNANIANYPYQYNISTDTRYNFGGVIAPGAAVKDAANQNIKWETTTTANFGLDFTLFKNTLSGTVDIYDRTAKDILYQVPVSSTLGLNAPIQNAGSIQNRGIEVSLTYNNKIGNVNFGVSPNFSYNDQKVIKIAGDIQSVIPNFFLGQPLNPIYGFVADGLFVDAADVASYPTQPNGGAPGNIRFKDISGPNGVPDGKVDATYDRQILGNTNPKISYGLNLNASYKGFDASVLFSGLGGYTVQMGSYQAYALYNGGNVQQWQYENAWTTQNPDRNAIYPRITNLSQGSANVQRNSFWNRSGTFLRLKNAQIGYTIPTNLTKKIGLEKLRVFAGGQNLFIINDFYEGWDPENGQGSGDNPNFYPLTAIYTLGINVKL